MVDPTRAPNRPLSPPSLAWRSRIAFSAADSASALRAAVGAEAVGEAETEGVCSVVGDEGVLTGTEAVAVALGVADDGVPAEVVALGTGVGDTDGVGLTGGDGVGDGAACAQPTPITRKHIVRPATRLRRIAYLAPVVRRIPAPVTVSMPARPEKFAIRSEISKTAAFRCRGPGDSSGHESTGEGDLVLSGGQTPRAAAHPGRPLARRTIISLTDTPASAWIS